MSWVDVAPSGESLPEMADKKGVAAPMARACKNRIATVRFCMQPKSRNKAALLQFVDGSFGCKGRRSTSKMYFRVIT